jgi:hypothetical protein
MNNYASHRECLAGVQKYGWLLQYIPDEMKTHDICIAAVQNHGNALKHVPREKKTYEICLAAVQKDGYAIRFVPDEKITPEICLAAVQNSGYALEFVPEEKKTHEMCLLAVQNGGYTLYFIPEHLQSDEIIQAALLEYPEAVKYIKKTITIIHGTPKQMPPKAYDTLQMGYDEETAIQDGELMVDFHNEFDYGRFYRKKTFEDMILPFKKNGYTGVAIREYTIYQAIV